MKRKFKLIDQYQQKGHLTSLSTNTTTYDVENAGPWLGQIKYCGGVKPVNGIPAIPSW
jgi:hypothetical protein